MNRAKRIFWAMHLFWILSHVILWLKIGQFDVMPNKYIWPEKEPIETLLRIENSKSYTETIYNQQYDISDFLIYITAPVILYFVIVLLFPGKKRIINNKFKRIFLAMYILWISTHFLLWFRISQFSVEVNKYIWPEKEPIEKIKIENGRYLEEWDIQYYISQYEISDFLLYTIAPVILYLVVVLLFPNKKNKKDE